MHNGKAGYGRDGDDGSNAPFTLKGEKARAPEQYLGQRAEYGESKGGQHLSHLAFRLANNLIYSQVRLGSDKLPLTQTRTQMRVAEIALAKCGQGHALAVAIGSNAGKKLLRGFEKKHD